LFLIVGPSKTVRLQGVGNVKGSVKRVMIELTASNGVEGSVDWHGLVSVRGDLSSERLNPDRRWQQFCPLGADLPACLTTTWLSACCRTRGNGKK
jgi:hypothetical protein